MTREYDMKLARLVFLCAVAAFLAGCSATVVYQSEVPLVNGQIILARLTPAKEAVPADTPAAKWQVVDWSGGLDPVHLGESCSLEVLRMIGDGNLVNLVDWLEFFPGFGVEILERIRVTSVGVQNIVLNARLGDFSSFRRIRYDLHAPGAARPLIAAEGRGGFDTRAVLKPMRNYDLLAMFADGNVSCLANFITLDGAIPRNEVVFDASMFVRIEFRVHIF